MCYMLSSPYMKCVCFQLVLGSAKLPLAGAVSDFHGSQTQARWQRVAAPSKEV